MEKNEYLECVEFLTLNLFLISQGLFGIIFYMQNNCSIKISVHLTMIIMLITIVMICRYRLENRIGYIIFPIEAIFLIICLYWDSTHIANYHILNGVCIKYYLLFAFYRILSSIVVTESVYNSTKQIVYFEIAPFFLAVFLFKIFPVVDILKIIRNTGIINSILGVYELVSHSSLFLDFISVDSRRLITGGFGTNDARVRTVFIHPIICGVFTTVIWILLIYFPFKRKWVNYCCRLATIICLIGTQSRSSWVAFFIVFLLNIFRNIHFRTLDIKKLKNLLLILFLTGLLILLFYDRFRTFYILITERWISGLDSNNKSNFNRVMMLRMGINDFIRNDIFHKIFGGGKEYAIKLLKNNSILGWNIAVDNSYLSVLLDYGLLGLFIFVSQILYFCNKYFSKNPICQACSLSLIAIFSSGFFYDIHGWFIVDFLISIFICGISFTEDNEQNRSFKIKKRF